MISHSLLAFLTLLPQALAWGTLGHDTVAFIAQNFVSEKTADFAQQLLNDTSTAYLANVATWADSYRRTTEGAFSAPLHYIDALDKPPESCNVDYDRDCPEEGCVVSAIANYTTRVQGSNISNVEKQKALKWIVHFVGDIHQPLHVENLDVGGNTINVTFEGDDTNLHHIWDSDMAEKLIGGFSLEDARKWSQKLSSEITSGKYANQSKSWLEGINLKDSVQSAMVWAKDANSFICSTVVPKGADAVRGEELDGTYYDSAIPIIQVQIAKAGYRLAAWLDLIVTGSTELGHGDAYAQPRGFGAWEKKQGGMVKREEWMEEARRVRRAFSWNCGPEGHAH